MDIEEVVAAETEEGVATVAAVEVTVVGMEVVEAVVEEAVLLTMFESSSMVQRFST